MMAYKLRKGTRVRIIKDIRKRESATGKTGKFIGCEEREVWTLMSADGAIERESYHLPEGYVEWDNEKDMFPKVKCGVHSQDPIFLLEDGSKINGGHCFWEPINPKIRQKMENDMKEFLVKLGEKEPEKILRDYKNLWR